MSKKKMIRVAEYARLMGISVQAVYAKVKDQKLPSEKIGDTLYVPFPDNPKFIEV